METLDYCTAIPPATCQNQRNFYYYVKAVNSQYNESPASNTVTANLVGGPPDKISIIDNNSIVANNYTLSQNYPNPFNPSTIISYTLPEDSKVQIKIFDILGHEVAILTNEIKPAGYYEITFDASKLVSGIYFYTLRANSHSITKKMILAK